MTINEAAHRGHKHADRHGFYFDDSEAAIIDKLREEVDELETGFICKLTSDIKAFDDADTFSDKEWMARFESEIKNTQGDELADIVITALSSAVELGIDIERHIKNKLIYNEWRRY